VMWRTYAACLDGGQKELRRRMEAAGMCAGSAAQKSPHVSHFGRFALLVSSDVSHPASRASLSSVSLVPMKHGVEGYFGTPVP
jgi:hypothetical protein